MKFNIYANYESNGQSDLIEIVSFKNEEEVDKYCDDLEFDDVWYSYELIEE